MKVIRRAVQAGLVVGMMGAVAFAQSLGDARKAIDAEQYQQAKTILKKLIAEKPAEGENYFYLGNIYQNLDYPDSAKATYTKGVTAASEFPLNYVGLGSLALNARNSAQAKTNFDKALSLAKKKDDSPYLYIGKAYVLAKDYDSAISNLEKAKAINDKDAEVYMALGDAYVGQKKNSEAFSAYRTAFDMDKNLLRAKLELGKSIKRSKAFKEAADEFNAVLAANPNYAPAYRELAETYYEWAKDLPAEYDAKINQALQYYSKYMDLTDRSLESRMRYADFLVLAGKYGELEKEAQTMAQLDKANPRIYRYLGYSAYENGHFDESVTALKDFISKVDTSRVIAQDYYYLGRAKLKTSDTTGLSDLSKAVNIDSAYATEMSNLAADAFKERKYDISARLYELATKGPKATLIDHFYVGMSYYWDYATKMNNKPGPSKDNLVKADSAFSYVNRYSPSTADAYLYRARVNRLLDDEQNSKGLMVPFYERYITVVNEKPENLQDARFKKNLVEAYDNVGAYYVNSNPAKAKEYFNKSLALDPNNKYASDVLKSINGK